MTAELPATRPPSRRRLLIVLAGLGMLAYMAAAIAADAQALTAALERLGRTGVALVLGLSLLNYLLRFERWARYLGALGHALPRAHHGCIYMAGFAFTVSPAKAGEAVRALYLRPLGVPYADSIAALFVERLLDLLAMALLSTLMLAGAPGQRGLLVAVLGLAAASIWLLSRPGLPPALDALAKRQPGGIGAALARLAEGLHSAHRLLRPRMLFAGLAAGLIAWGAEGIGFGLILSGLDQPLGLPAATGVYALAVLAGGAAFFLPGGIGGMEMAMSALLLTQGVPLPAAIIATLVCRLATLWFAVAIGLVAAAVLEARGLAEPEVAPR